MSAVCPACGVAVVPGYAKCPKCHKPLPGGGRRARTVAGGTVAEDRRFPVALVAVPIGSVIVVALALKMCSGGSSDEAQPTTAQPTQPTQQQVGTAPPSTSAQPVEPPTTTRPSAPQAPSSSAAVAELDRVLRGRRFWSTIDVTASRVDVRSGSCDDPAMGPTIDSVAPTLRGAGLTRLRCLAQSGTVVFERDL